jgi:tRNA U34 5-methylaminomethyl-2-thiouridine-forming methyltransferase MnmC
VREREVSKGFTLVTVASGARSVRSLEYGETFHPVVGPMAEARGLHVAQSRLAGRLAVGEGPFVIWDVGLGAAANAIAALETALKAEPAREVELHSFDSTAEPLEFAAGHAEELGYLAGWLSPVKELLANGSAEVGRVRWYFQRVDFCDFVRAPTVPAPDAILYDPYSQAVSPEMWTLEHFSRLRKCLADGPPCTLTSYTRSTAVRVTLLLAGFFVGRGGSIGEKDQTTVAATQRGLLAEPLGADWLKRVERSTRGAPLREGASAGRISPRELAALQVAIAAK